MMRAFPKHLRSEFAVFKPLATPVKVQDFVDAIPMNFERSGGTSRSPRAALARGEAQCMEGAMIAAAALWYHGEPPLLLDLRTTKRAPRKDADHVVALFRQGGRWGAISKTNHAVLRYREPIYRDVRELAMSYFHEYFLDNGHKTLREYSAPFDLRRCGDAWLTARHYVWDVNNALDDSRHFPVLPQGAVAKLRRADAVERAAGKVVQWRSKLR